MPSLHHPSGNGCVDRVPILGVTFFQIATIDKLGAINPIIFLAWVYFFEKLLL